jgi:3-dehydroquinate synthase
MKSLQVDLADRSYDVLIGSDAIMKLPAFLQAELRQKKTYIITDENVAKLHLPRIENLLREAKIEVQSKILPAGESTKSFEHLQQICDWLLQQKIERKTTIIALGGGVIGDLVGFAASILLRGINFIQIPTTLLAQVDSSVGGKTAINSPEGKNLIGAFYQPKLVIADTEILQTLPKREFLSGYGEIVKYGLINAPEFFDWLCVNSLETQANLQQAIYFSCEAKASIVAADEREGGIRALLNLGHTFGHALEAETGFSDKLLHGEAVALGCVMAFKLSAFLGYCEHVEVDKVIAHFEQVGLPTDPHKYLQKWDIDALVSHMQSDKKVKDGKIVFILAHAIGRAYVDEEVEEKSLRKFLQEYK